MDCPDKPGNDGGWTVKSLLNVTTRLDRVVHLTRSGAEYTRQYVARQLRLGPGAGPG